MPHVVSAIFEVPSANKDEFLGVWPSLKADLAKQPGVLDVGGGEIVGENFSQISEFKFLQSILFASAAEDKAFADSAWAKDYFEHAKAKANMVGPPTVRKFQVGDPPGAPKNLTEFVFLELADLGKEEEVKQAWMDLEAAIGDKALRGRSVDDGPPTGMGALGWDSTDQVIEVYKRPEVASAWDKYKSYGKVYTFLVKFEA